MIKICANLSKKMPLPGVDYSSQQYGAAMEIEVSDADKPEIIQQRIRELYSLLSTSIDEQIGGTAQPMLPAPARLQAVQPQQSVQQRPAYTNGRNRTAIAQTNGNGRGIGASQAQCRAIFAICKSQGIDMASVLADFNVADPKDLHVKDASRLIDQLKNGSGAAAH